jgi:hypothetical protein
MEERDFHWGFMKLNEYIDFRYNRIPKNVKDDYLSVINKFNIREEIINSVANQLLDMPFISIHIRTWNTPYESTHTDKYRNQYFNDNKHNFIKYALQSNIKHCLISSDNHDYINDIIEKLSKDKIIIYYKKNNEFNKLQNDFAELLLCSKGEIIIGSYMSTYTELIWWFSKCNKNIFIV